MNYHYNEPSATSKGHVKYPNIEIIGIDSHPDNIRNYNKGLLDSLNKGN